MLFRSGHAHTCPERCALEERQVVVLFGESNKDLGMAGLVGQKHAKENCPEEGIVQEHPENQQGRKEEQVGFDPKLGFLYSPTYRFRFFVFCHQTLHDFVFKHG